MKIAFRTDASVHIGTGHVMRCLTLAHELRRRGAQCRFITRAHSGNLIERIEADGFSVDTLPAGEPDFAAPSSSLAHAYWLGATQAQDAEQSLSSLNAWRPDWLVVDHYALDSEWEKTAAVACGRLMVIDDLADRTHLCHLLLDQTLGRTAADYADWVPSGCTVLAGPSYALLRPEFGQLRAHSLARRQTPSLHRILITMGGIDQMNATGMVLEALGSYPLASQCEITAVMGAAAPALERVREQAATMRAPTEVVVNVRDMGRRMSEADLAIGAGGSTSWERCCLGLPTALVVLAQNQWPGARALSAHKAVALVGETGDIAANLPAVLDRLSEDGALRDMARRASSVCDGLSASRVADIMQEDMK